MFKHFHLVLFAMLLSTSVYCDTTNWLDQLKNFKAPGTDKSSNSGTGSGNSGLPTLNQIPSPPQSPPSSSTMQQTQPASNAATPYSGGSSSSGPANIAPTTKPATSASTLGDDFFGASKTPKADTQDNSRHPSQVDDNVIHVEGSGSQRAVDPDAVPRGGDE